MRCNNSMNASSLTCKGMARKALKVRKNGQIFGQKMFGLPLYLRNAAPSKLIKRGSNSPAYELRNKRRKKKEGRKKIQEEKWGIKSKTNKKKHTHTKHLHAHTFSHRDPCAMTFRERKILAMLDCEEYHIYFRFLVLKLFSISFLCWIPEVYIQPYPHFGCIFQNPRPFWGYVALNISTIFVNC